jgi:hypothetical protein
MLYFNFSSHHVFICGNILFLSNKKQLICFFFFFGVCVCVLHPLSNKTCNPMRYICSLIEDPRFLPEEDIVLWSMNASSLGVNGLVEPYPKTLFDHMFKHLRFWYIKPWHMSSTKNQINRDPFVIPITTTWWTSI